MYTILHACTQQPLRFGVYEKHLEKELPAWSVFCLDDPEELFMELQWASNRPESNAKKEGCLASA